jgi:hypothetical protein
MGCASNCYADYMLSSGNWAGAYGDHFGGLVTPTNAAECTTTLTATAGKWHIAVRIPTVILTADAVVAGTVSARAAVRDAGVDMNATYTTRTWDMDPIGYMQLSEVQSVQCGDPTDMNSTFACVVPAG